MTTIILGSNRFVDCMNLIGFKNAPLLQVRSSPPEVILTLPEPLDIASDAWEIIKSDSSFSIFKGDSAIAIATQRKKDVVHLKLDLRPLGINVFDDIAGLHVGNNVFSGNTLEHIGTAINLS